MRLSRGTPFIFTSIRRSSSDDSWDILVEMQVVIHGSLVWDRRRTFNRDINEEVISDYVRHQHAEATAFLINFEKLDPHS